MAKHIATGSIYRGRNGWFFEVWRADCLIAHGWKPSREAAYAVLLDANKPQKGNEDDLPDLQAEYE